MYAEDKNGNEFIVQATTKNDNEVNGNQSLQGDIEYNKVNAQFINEMDSLWKLYDHEGKTYKIITLNRKGKGDKMYITFTAIPLFFDYMDTDSIFDDKGVHYKYDGHFTAKNAFDKIFTGTPFDYVLVDTAEAVEWENFGGGESRLESFKRALDRYHYEFEIRGNTVYLKNQAGRNTSIQYRHQFNASDINQEIDASEQITGIKGYGNFGEGTNEDASEEDYRDARLKREYVSPLAHVIDDKIRWGFFADGRMKVSSAMDKKLKSVVENSLKVSVNATVHNLTKQGYPIDVSQAGDRVFLVDERIGFNQEVRIISQSITRNWLGEIIDASITFGDEGLGKRHQSNISTVTKQIGDIFSGKAEMPLSHLDKRVQEISNIINGNTDSIFKYTPNGVFGWNGTDPNYMTKYVGDSIGFSRDGGETYGTAMSADLGIVADYINTGTLRAIMIEGVKIYGSLFYSETGNDYMQIVGGNIELNQFSGRQLKISPTGFYGYDANGRIRFQADSSMVTSSVLGTSTANVYLGAEAGQEARMVNYVDLPGTGHPSEYNYIPVRAIGFKGNYLDVNHQGTNAVNLYLRTPTDGEIRATSVGTTDVYRPIRAHKLFAEHIETNEFEILSLRTNDRVRVQGKGTSGAYKDIQAKSMFVKELTTHPDVTTVQNLYLGSENEVRSVNSGYIYGNSGVFYRGFRGSSFIESSSRELKENIKPLTETALNVIENLEVVEYNLINEKESVGLFRSMPKKERHVGFIAETSNPISSDDGKAVNIGKTTAYLTKAIQELDVNLTTEVNRIDNKLSALETENKQLKSRLHKIEKLLEVV